MLGKGPHTRVSPRAGVGRDPRADRRRSRTRPERSGDRADPRSKVCPGSQNRCSSGGGAAPGRVGATRSGCTPRPGRDTRRGPPPSGRRALRPTTSCPIAGLSLPRRRTGPGPAASSSPSRRSIRSPRSSPCCGRIRSPGQRSRYPGAASAGSRASTGSSPSAPPNRVVASRTSWSMHAWRAAACSGVSGGHSRVFTRPGSGCLARTTSTPRPPTSARPLTERRRDRRAGDGAGRPPRPAPRPLRAGCRARPDPSARSRGRSRRGGARSRRSSPPPPRVPPP